MKRREFIALLGGAAAGRRSRRTAQQPRNCRPSGIWARARLRSRANGSLLWYSGCANSAGPRAATSPSSFVGQREQRARCRDRGRVRPDQSRCHCHIRNPPSHRGKASYIAYPDCIRVGGGPGWHRPSREFGTTGRQRHRPI